VDWLIHKTLKRKVFVFVLVILLSYLAGFFYTFYASNKVNTAIERMFETSVSLTNMKETLDAYELHLDNYLATKDSDSFVAYIDTRQEITACQAWLNHGVNENPMLLQMTNISRMLDGYLHQGDQAVTFKRARNIERYLESFRELTGIRLLVDQKVDEVLMWDYDWNLEQHTLLSLRLQRIQSGLVLITMLLIALGLLFVFSFSTEVTRPITALSERANKISQGQYDGFNQTAHGFREADLLEKAFNTMSGNIKMYISELEGKVETENQLRDSEIEKLKIRNLLNKAELMALQSQINPHFLFNTLNAGMQLAMIENADRTSVFLENLSNLFRYNIQPLNNQVTLLDEINSVRHYAQLMNVRYGDGITFRFDIAPNLEALVMPPLILQPVIENGIIHGFANRLSNRRVEIRAFAEAGMALIEVEDNGQGIAPEILEKLNHNNFHKAGTTESHTTGLGLENVHERLKNLGGKLSFESERQRYTRVRIALPLEVTTIENYGG
jgi:two-component system, sensor histidine kinase YesM